MSSAERAAPPASTWKFGVSVVPCTSMRLSGPWNSPVELSMPASPLMVSRFAFSNTYLPVTGVRAGCATFQGPNVPDVSISPFGTGLVSVAM